MDCTQETVQFVTDLMTIGYDLCKSLAVDATLAKYKPSVLAACLLFISFQLQFEILVKQSNLSLGSQRMRELVSQISGVFCHWRFSVLDRMLGTKEISKIMDFCEHVLARQCTLF